MTSPVLADHAHGGTTPTLAEARDRLLAAGLRPTRPRLRLIILLTQAGERQVTPADLMTEAWAAGLRLPLATIYNNLNRFAEVGLLKRIAVGPGEVFFDTNTGHHHYVFYEERGELRPVPARDDGFVDLPDDLADLPPERLDVVIRVREK